MRASDPLQSKRVLTSLFTWSTAFLTSCLSTSETISNDGIDNLLNHRVNLDWPGLNWIWDKPLHYLTVLFYFRFFKLAAMRIRNAFSLMNPAASAWLYEPL